MQFCMVRCKGQHRRRSTCPLIARPCSQRLCSRTRCFFCAFCGWRRAPIGRLLRDKEHSVQAALSISGSQVIPNGVLLSVGSVPTSRQVFRGCLGTRIVIKKSMGNGCIIDRAAFSQDASMELAGQTPTEESTKWSGLVSLALRLHQLVRRSEEDPSFVPRVCRPRPARMAVRAFSARKICIWKSVPLSMTHCVLQ